MREIEIVAENAGRIDTIVAWEIDDVSRSYAQKLIKDGEVTLNGNLAKSSDIAKLGDVIFVRVPEPEVLDVRPENIELDIVYEDDELLVVNKPSGMVVHPAAGHNSGTLVNALLAHCNGHLSGINGVLRPGILHRLDKDTSGLLLVAKSDLTHLSLAKQLSERSLVRRYKALVVGNIDESGTVDAPIGRSPKDRKKRAINGIGAKKAVTHYKPIEAFDLQSAGKYTLIECRLETGRTHQIRVHMASIGRPILGDCVYGSKNTKKEQYPNGQLLHAYLVGFVHPRTGEYMEFSVDLPQEFQKMLDLFA